MSNVTEQLFTNAFNAGVRYAEEPDADTRLSRLAKDRTEFGEIAARLLALLAPEPEPSDAEIEAATRTLWDLHHLTLGYDDPRSDNFRELYRENAKAVLAAAWQARAQASEGETAK